MKFYRYKYILYSMGLIILAGGFAACSSMHSPYEEFIEDGIIVYPATLDSIKVHSGKNRIQLSFLLPSDPTISKARIYWHNGQDSVEVPIDRSQTSDTMSVMLTDLAEGSYTFDIYTYDDEGNSSIRLTAIGMVYGDNYISSLLPRLITEAVFADETLKIKWSSADETVFATEISYMDISGDSRQIYTPGENDSTIVLDYDFNNYNTFQYRTLYKPDSMAVDTFYTDYETVRALGPIVELSKTGWTATASSYDTRHGTARAPGSAIDNNPGTIWVNSIAPQTDFPHSITVDMGSVEEEIFGLSFTVQNRNETPQSIEMLISDDGTNWTSMGIFPLENADGTQYIAFSEIQDLRYFKVIAIAPHGNTPNVVIAEIGAYRR